MGKLNQTLVMNEDLQIRVQELERELAHKDKQIIQLLKTIEDIQYTAHVSYQDYFALEDAHAER